MVTNPFEELSARLDRIEGLILSKTAAPEPQETLSLAQASKLCQISPSRMYELSRKKLIPSSRIGQRYVFIRADLLNWLRSQVH